MATNSETDDFNKRKQFLEQLYARLGKTIAKGNHPAVSKDQLASLKQLQTQVQQAIDLLDSSKDKNKKLPEKKQDVERLNHQMSLIRQQMYLMDLTRQNIMLRLNLLKAMDAGLHQQAEKKLKLEEKKFSEDISAQDKKEEQELEEDFKKDIEYMEAQKKKQQTMLEADRKAQDDFELKGKELSEPENTADLATEVSADAGDISDSLLEFSVMMMDMVKMQAGITMMSHDMSDELKGNLKAMQNAQAQNNAPAFQNAAMKATDNIDHVMQNAMKNVQGESEQQKLLAGINVYYKQLMQDFQQWFAKGTVPKHQRGSEFHSQVSNAVHNAVPHPTASAPSIDLKAKLEAGLAGLKALGSNTGSSLPSGSYAYNLDKEKQETKVDADAAETLRTDEPAREPSGPEGSEKPRRKSISAIPDPRTGPKPGE